MKKIYIAGFDVFYPDAVNIGNKLKGICRKYGFKGLFPSDNECGSADDIFSANIGMIQSCDIVAANMNSFRGVEPDSGTAFELGYAYSLGKRLYCYLSDTRTLRDKIGEKDDKGLSVEDFGFPLNLMISVPTVIVNGNFEDCLIRIRHDEDNKTQE